MVGSSVQEEWGRCRILMLKSSLVASEVQEEWGVFRVRGLVGPFFGGASVPPRAQGAAICRERRCRQLTRRRL